MKERTACDGGSQAASKEPFTAAGEGAIVKYVLWPQAKRWYHSWASGDYLPNYRAGEIVAKSTPA